ncbi:MAG: FGGY-family carbohydrate kinase [Spirochaetaceae bacterium]|jgi:sugar (pentulose or hexulose) kinase|nr:FGGY-family carbohydrate kinase [Spirochaetaceae bacterium]
MDQGIKEIITAGKTFLGIELGSTRIKAVLIGEDYAPIASGGYDWENRLEDGIWTYHLDDVWKGIQSSFHHLSREITGRYGVSFTPPQAIGISAMMHGYLAFDKGGGLLAPFRTWRNTTTEKAAQVLSEKFHFTIPLRWSIAHLYQAILNREDHVRDIAFLTTLAGYVHWKLTGEKVLGIGDASGMFPIDSGTKTYQQKMLEHFEALSLEAGLKVRLRDMLPRVLAAGENAGTLSAEGAKLIDPAGNLPAGIPLCPPEGDAGTGMVATNSVAERTGNVSAGTSIFAMVVLEKDLSRMYPEIDMVTTPSGKPVAMVHCNNCTSDLDAWLKLFNEVLQTFGAGVEKPALYDALYGKALEGETDGGGLLSYNYYGGEPITALEQGRPLFVRMPDSSLSLANFMRVTLYSTMAALKIGMDILTEKEQIRLDRLLGHGGLFKTKAVGQRLLASALNVPVAVMESAGEGGAWGIALLAAYSRQKGETGTLEDFLEGRVFARNRGESIKPDPQDQQGFAKFMERYRAGIAIESAAVENLR